MRTPSCLALSNLEPGSSPTTTKFVDLLTLLDRFADAWNRHDLDALMSMMTDDCVFEASAGPQVDGQRSEGPHAVRAAFASSVDALVIHRFVIVKDYWQMRDAEA